MILSISGPMHVGKTTLAKGLVYKYENVIRAPMAQALRELCDRLGIKETRESLQAVGHGLRAADPDVWVRAWYLRYGVFNTPDTLLIIDDARYQNEVDMADHSIYLDCDPFVQWERYQTSDKFVKSLTREEWEQARVHTTEQQDLNFTAQDYYGALTNQKNIDDVLSEVSLWLSPRLSLTKREEVMELPW